MNNNDNTLHYYHKDGRIIGDVMPYYDNGTYHLFYLLNGSGHNEVNHEHAISKDLIHWTNLTPSIIKDKNNFTGLNNGCMFTGCYLKDNGGKYHCFYTGWNPLNKDGREFILHATSLDLISWQKDEMVISPDSRYYSTVRFRDFRDPCVFFDESSKMYHMFILANRVGHDNTISSWDQNWVTGHYQSANLLIWEALPPLECGLGDECPDYFEINGTHYLHGCKKYVVADNRFGPYKTLEHNTFDLPTFRAAKTCFDGKRRLWFGGFGGGPTNLPREVIQLSDKSLGLVLADEVYKTFSFPIQGYMLSRNEKSNIIVQKSRLIKIRFSAHSIIQIQLLPMGTTITVNTILCNCDVVQIDGHSFNKKLRAVDGGIIDLVVEKQLLECYINSGDVISVDARNEIEDLTIIDLQDNLSVSIFSTL